MSPTIYSFSACVLPNGTTLILQALLAGPILPFGILSTCQGINLDFSDAQSTPHALLLALPEYEQTMNYLSWSYGQDQISDAQTYEIYENTKAIYGNLNVINNNLEKLSSSGRRKLRVAQGELPQIYLPPWLGWETDKVTGHTRIPNRIFSAETDAISFLRESLMAQDDILDLDITPTGDSPSCSLQYEVRPTMYYSGEEQAGEAKTFVLSMDKAPPTVSCGFLESSQKAMVAAESTGMMASSFFYNIEVRTIHSAAGCLS
jgi:hypothetical protein